MNYFDHHYLSNSKLSAFGAELGFFRSFGENNDPFENYRLGTLFDLIATEPCKVDRLNKVLIDTPYFFTDEELKQNEIMFNKLKQHPVYKSILDLNPSFQTEIYEDNFIFDNLPGVGFKAKLDLFLKGWVIDLKTTACTSQQQFEAACEMFGYFRQMILYMILTKSKKSTIIGVSKAKPYNVFIVNFDENHPLYKSNYDTIKELIFKYIFLG